MKKWVLFLFAFSIASADLIHLPTEFQVVERFLSLTSTFDVGTDYQTFAMARKRFFSLTSSFDLEDMYHNPLATATSRFFSWGTIADVVDPSGKKIGWIEEELFRFFSWSEYKVFNHFNQLVAIAKMNFWGTEFELTHPDHPELVYATIGRPFFRCCRDYWTVQIKNDKAFDQGLIDPRLLVILAIYQTDHDNRDRTRREVLNQLDDLIDDYFED